MIDAAIVGVGGVLGAWSRFLLGQQVERRAVDTVVVNIVGSFLFGFLLAAQVSDSAMLVFGIGFCGAFTTFSSFAVETVLEFEDGNTRLALLNAVGTLAAALVAVAVGTLFGSVLT